MKIKEITSAEEQLDLLRVIIDNTWTAIRQQAEIQAKQGAAKVSKPKATKPIKKPPYAAPPYNKYLQESSMSVYHACFCLSWNWASSVNVIFCISFMKLGIVTIGL